jgi:peptidoglycan LD-endopeptidase LytH
MAGFVLGAVLMLVLVTDSLNTRRMEIAHADGPAAPPNAPFKTARRQDGRNKPAEAAAVDTSGFPRDLRSPVQDVSADDIQDTFSESRGSDRKHEATDILAPRGTPVLAADDGTIKKLFLSKAGGITLYQFDPTEQYSYYYAHLDRYADGIREGMPVKQGDVIGYVGSTGNAPANTPHLHFGIFKLGEERRWSEGTPINPYPILIRKVQ